MNKAQSLRERILNAQDIKSERVTIEEWGVEVEVRGMTGAARARVLQVSFDKNGTMDHEKLYPELLIASVFDPESGEKVFSGADREALAEKSAGALEQVARVAMRLSGIDPEARDEAEKNS